MRGRALSEPKNATNESVKGLRIPFQLWDVRCTYYKDELIKATPLPDCCKQVWGRSLRRAITPSISFSDDRDKNARGSVDMFYMSQDDAQQAAEAMLKGTIEDYHPSTDWSQGGPIIERERIDIVSDPNGTAGWMALTYVNFSKVFKSGPTPLIAAMRCYVASKLGDEAEIPEELL